MADDELIIPIDKAYWPRGVMRGLTPLLRSLGDKHGNIVIAAVPNKHIMLKGPANRIEEVKAPLRELFEEHFPDAPVPEELGGEGEAQAEEESSCRSCGNTGIDYFSGNPCSCEYGQQIAAERAAASKKAAASSSPSAGDQMKKKMEERRNQMEGSSPKSSPKSAPAPKSSPKSTPAAAPAAARPTASGSEPSWAQKIGGVAETAEASLPAPAKKTVAELVAPVAWAKLVAAGTPAKPAKGRKQPRPAAMVAPDLLWQCVKNNSSFLRHPTKALKRSHRPFSADPCNLLGVHSLKFSGVANEALNVRSVKNGKKESIELVQSHAKTSRHRRPKSAFVASGLSKCPKRGLARLDQEMDGKFYRRDLLDLAKVKYAKVQRSFKTKKRIVKSRRAKN